MFDASGRADERNDELEAKLLKEKQ